MDKKTFRLTGFEKKLCAFLSLGLGGEKRVFLLSETQRNALRGETIVSLEVSGEFVIAAEVSPC